MEIDWIPGMKNIRLKDLPSFVRTTNPNNFTLKFFTKELNRAHKALAMVLNTFHEFKGEVVNALSSIFHSPIYTIDPFPSFLNQNPLKNSSSIGSNL